VRQRNAICSILSFTLLAVLHGCSAPVPAPDEVAAVDIEEAAPASAVVDLGPTVEVSNSPAQIAAAVTAAPGDLREAASVYGYDQDGGLVLLRQGAGELICLADDPGDDRFHTACYHRLLEPYMARGRQLKAEGVTGPDSFTIRHAEIDGGSLDFPLQPTMVYSLGGGSEMHDPATGAVEEGQGRRVHAVYVAYATEASTGLSTTPPQTGAPWIMRPGTPSSHIMVVLEPTETTGGAQ